MSDAGQLIGVPLVAELPAPRVIAEGLSFPEGPVALSDESVLVVEMRRGTISCCGRDGSVSVVADVGGGPNGAAIGPDGHLYVCNNGGRSSQSARQPSIQVVDLDTGRFWDLYVECDGIPFGSPNDLVFDETGNFWFTDLRGNSIYYASPDGRSVERALERVANPNGVGLAPDGSSLYWAQTHTRQVMRRRLLAPGKLRPSPGYGINALLETGSVDPDSLVVGLPGGQELDSLAVEADGSVCVGTLVDSGITVVDPSGGVREKYVLPPDLADGAVTNICFGGSDMCTAYLTLSVTGRLVECRWPRPGLPLCFNS